MSSTKDAPVWQFGVLLLPGYQLLDAAGPMDYINSHSHAFLAGLSAASAIPSTLLTSAPAITWHYVSSLGNLDPITPSSGPIQYPTHTFASCPKLDYLLVPGGSPFDVLSDECVAFIQEQVKGAKGLLTVCSGSMCIAQTGVLDGLSVDTSKWVLRFLASPGQDGGESFFKRAKLDRVNWVTDKRFVRDGKVWSAAGVTAGIDLAAEFCREVIAAEIVDAVRTMSEYASRPAVPDEFAFILEGVKLR